LHDWARAGVEGVVAKGAGTRYRGGVRQFVKVKSRDTVEAVVGAVTGPIDRPHTLIVGRHHAGRLVIVGRSTPLLGLLAAELAQHLAHRAAPVAGQHPRRLRPAPQRTHRAHHVHPALVVPIAVDTAIDHGRHRHPIRLVRVRLDLQPVDQGGVQRDRVSLPTGTWAVLADSSQLAE
jgi:ATP-dependent DNA ligase